MVEKSAGTAIVRPSLATFMGRLSLLFVAVVALLVTIGVLVWQTSDRYVTEDRWVAHALEVKNQVGTVLTRFGAIQTAAAVYAAAGALPRLADFNAESPQLDDDVRALAALTADNPIQVRRVGEFAEALLARRDLFAHIVAERQQSGQLPALPERGAELARRLGNEILAAEDVLLVQRRREARSKATSMRVLTAAAELLSAAFLTLAFLLTRGTHIRQQRAQQSLQESHVHLATALDEALHLSHSMQQLTQVGELLQSCRSLDEVREGIPGALTNLLPGIGGRLALLNPSQNLLAIGAHWGEHGLIAESVFAPEDCWALRRGQMHPLAGGSGGFVCKHVHWPSPDVPAASYVCVPLSAQGETIGVLTIDAVRPLDVTECRLAVAAAEQLALALANLRLQDTLRTQSIRDPLTGLFNRRYLEVSLERELMRAGRRSLPLAVLMLDLDHFKQVNDTHGHDAGDSVLAQFAEVLKRNTRSEDIACRYGGEEFTVILLEADDDSARKRAEQIRMAVSAMSVEHRREQLAHVTVSIGYAAFPRDGNTSEDLLRRADIALYIAKKAGRNRIASAEEEGTQDFTQTV